MKLRTALIAGVFAALMAGFHSCPLCTASSDAPEATYWCIP